MEHPGTNQTLSSCNGTALPSLDKVPVGSKSSGDSGMKQYLEVTMPAQSTVFSSHRYRIVLIAWLVLLIVNPVVAGSITRARQDASTSQQSSASPVAILLVQADMDCTFRLDDQPGMALKANEPTKVQTGLGEHLLNAVSLDGRDHWKLVVELAQPMQKVVLIDLLNVQMARLKTGQEAPQSQRPQQAVSNEQKPAEPSKGTSKQAPQQDAAKHPPSSPAGAPVTQPSGVKHFSVLHTATHAHGGSIIIADRGIKFAPYDGDKSDAFGFPVGQVKEVGNSWLDGTDGFHIRLQNGKNYRFIPCKPSGSGSSVDCSYKDVIPGDGEQMADEIRAALASP
jgi:cell division protein FtsN